MVNRRNWLKANATLMGTFLFSTAEARDAYFFGEATQNIDNQQLVNLGSNENPYGFSSKSLKAMTESLTKGNRYGFNAIEELRTALAKHHNLTKDNILMGSGSSEILGLVAAMASMKKGHIVSSNPVFRIWVTAAEQFGLTVNWLPLDKGMNQQLNLMADAVNAQTSLIYLCNPNNPTGTVIPDAELRAFIQKFAPQTLVLVDEAYTEYAGCPSVSDLIATYPNLIIAKTFSKIYGMAGLRVGYALAQPETIKKLGKFQPWNNAGVSNVSAVAALTALSDTDFLQMAKQKNEEVMAFTLNFLKNKGVNAIASKTNFLFANVNHLKIDVAEEMKKQGFIIRNWDVAGEKWCRISLGTMAEMQSFTAAFAKFLV
jgi:histidinol-phosphate aminotransferase